MVIAAAVHTTLRLHHQACPARDPSGTMTIEFRRTSHTTQSGEIEAIHASSSGATHHPDAREGAQSIGSRTAKMKMIAGPKVPSRQETAPERRQKAAPHATLESFPRCAVHPPLFGRAPE